MSVQDEPTVPFRAQYSRFLGSDHLAALMLAQIIYWFSPDKEGRPKVQKFKKGDDGRVLWWIAKSNKDWEEELDLSRGQAKRCIDKLKSLGLIDTWLTNFDGHPTVHINLTIAKGRVVTKADLDNFHRKMGSKGDSHCTNPDSPLHESVQSITETTTETTNLLSAASPPTVIEEEKVKSISVPKKARVAATRPDSIATVLATQSTRKVALVTNRLAGIDALFTVKNLQAVLDNLMEKYLPAAPRLLVTTKSFGVLRKRIEAAKIQDIKSLLDFTIREWGKMASQNRAAFLKNPSKVKEGSILPPTPSFNDLAYRLPYFITCYANTTSAPGTTSPQDDKIAQLQAQLQAAKRENQDTRDYVRRVNRKRKEEAPQDAAPAPRSATMAPRRLLRQPKPELLVNTVTVGSENVGDDWTPPEWSGESQGTTKFVRRGARNGK